MTTPKTPSISFEFFPPKTPQGIEKLTETAKELGRLSPAFFSVTYGAAGSTREGTLATVKQLQNTTSFPVAPHLSCIGSSREEIVDILMRYKTMGAKRIIALRGDLPSGMGNLQGSEFQYASDLIKLIRETTADYFRIEVAAYPECHPEDKDSLKNILHFKAKVEAGANSAITQYFYNADAYFYFLDNCEKHGISIPIIPGIMPITNLEKLEKFSNTCGAEIPRWIRKGLATFEHDEESLKEFGVEVVYKLCEQLISGGAPGLHFYTLNKAESSVRICEALTPSLSRKRERGILLQSPVI